jgi:hypothetical protein
VLAVLLVQLPSIIVILAWVQSFFTREITSATTFVQNQPIQIRQERNVLTAALPANPAKTAQIIAQRAIAQKFLVMGNAPLVVLQEPY